MTPRAVLPVYEGWLGIEDDDSTAVQAWEWILYYILHVTPFDVVKERAFYIFRDPSYILKT